MINLIEISIKFMFLFFPLLPYIKYKNILIGNCIEIFILLFSYMSITFLILKNKNNKFLIVQFFLMNLYLVIYLLYGIFSRYGILEGLSAFRIYFEPVLFVVALIIIYKFRGLNNVLNVVKYSVYPLIILLAFGIIQIFYPNLIRNIYDLEMQSKLLFKTNFVAFSSYNRVISLMNDPNVYGVYLFFMYCILDNLYHNKFLNKKLYNVLILLTIINIFATNSRQALLLLLIYICFNNIIRIFKKAYLKKMHMSLNIFTKMFILMTIIIVIIYNLNYFLEKIIRVDTLLNLNGRVEKSFEIHNFMAQKNNLFTILFGNGINLGREFVFENSYYSLIYQVGIVGIIIYISILNKILRSVITKKNSLIENKSLVVFFAILVFIMYVGDWILIPQIMILIIINIFTYNISNQSNR